MQIHIFACFLAFYKPLLPLSPNSYYSIIREIPQGQRIRLKRELKGRKSSKKPKDLPGRRNRHTGIVLALSSFSSISSADAETPLLLGL
jgi:hypothetical protein